MNTTRLAVLPIERMEWRYSMQWWEWLQTSLTFFGVPRTFYGSNEVAEIKVGQFLDVYRTCQYKAAQIQALCADIERGNVPTDVLVLDGWFPGIEHLFYIRSLTGLSFRIHAVLHAGSWDEMDFISQKGVTPWARPAELSWLTGYDHVYVATNFHKDLIAKSVGDAEHIVRKIEIVDFPVAMPERAKERIPMVIFPHRLALEKRPDEFELLKQWCNTHPSIQWIRTAEWCSTKAAYYELLGKATVAVSTARQETFGIAMLEARNAGCHCIVPDRLSYRETFADTKRYNALGEAATMIKQALGNTEAATPSWYVPSMQALVSAIICKGKQ